MRIYVDGVCRDATKEEEERILLEQAEQARLEAEQESGLTTTNDEKIAELEKQNEMLTECLFELASIIYA